VLRAVPFNKRCPGPVAGASPCDPNTLERTFHTLAHGRRNESSRHRPHPALPTHPRFPTPVPEPAPSEPPVPSVRHCWVTDEHGRLPGLLLEWRRLAVGWQGRVVRTVCEDGSWMLVEEWLPADVLAAD
jgi:hypothetical protein